MKARLSNLWQAAACAALLTLSVACAKAPNDAKVVSDVQGKLAGDSGLQNKQLTVQSSNGVVTLSGTVDNDAQRTAATKYAASEPGVKTVINNLQVAGAELSRRPRPILKPRPQLRQTQRRSDLRRNPLARTGGRHTPNHRKLRKLKIHQRLRLISRLRPRQIQLHRRRLLQLRRPNWLRSPFLLVRRWSCG